MSGFVLPEGTMGEGWRGSPGDTKAASTSCSCPSGEHVPVTCEQIAGDAFTAEDDETTYSATPLYPASSMTLGDLTERVYQINLEKGWVDDDRTVGDDCALLHSEISEMLEEFRTGNQLEHVYFTQPNGFPLDPAVSPGPKDKPEGFGIELADLLIRVVDVAKRDHIDLERCLEVKLRFNATRPYRHGKVL